MGIVGEAEVCERGRKGWEGMGERGGDREFAERGREGEDRLVEAWVIGDLVAAEF